MKKVMIILLVLMNFVSVDAASNCPKYKIIANSNHEKDIKAMYELKDNLISDYRKWIKGVDDIDQVLSDHQRDYHAKYYNGEYLVVLGKGQGKSLEGKLQASYCTSSKEIKKKSLLKSFFS